MESILIDSCLELLGIGIGCSSNVLCVGQFNVFDAGIVLAHFYVLDWTELLGLNGQVILINFPSPLGTEGDGVVVQVDLKHERP
jgi:hypothetical protein